jgi:hypothetical protein
VDEKSHDFQEVCPALKKPKMQNRPKAKLKSQEKLLFVAFGGVVRQGREADL